MLLSDYNVFFFDWINKWFFFLGYIGYYFVYMVYVYVLKYII